MPKTIAFSLFDYFPHGGLQRDFLLIALECQRRGAEVRVYTLSWEGPVPAGFDVRIAPVRALSNHRRAKEFSTWLQRELREVACLGTVGFNKMPGLDVYFASDSCFAERASAKGFLYRTTPRCRTYLEMERAVFGRDASTRILLIAPRQRGDFMRHYRGVESRLELLPPVLNPAFRCPDPADARRRIRAEFGIEDGDALLLQVGSSFKTKGVDRAIRAVASLPEELRRKCLYLVAGKGKADRYRKLAKRLGIGCQVRFAGPREDVPDLMAAADMLIHPARNEAAGMTLTESLASGLPVICSGVCGYAPYIQEASAGLVLDEPFGQAALAKGLERLLASGELPALGRNALDYIQSIKPRNMHECAVNHIEETIGKMG